MSRLQHWAPAAIALGLCATAQAGSVAIEGTRSNISAGGIPNGRCAPAITVLFSPGVFMAEGSSNLGNFQYTASHCIAAPPPGSYFDGQFEWTFADGTVHGTHGGTLSVGATPGVFDVSEQMVFTGGTGRYAGASGYANAIGTLQFGMHQGQPASFGNVAFSGELIAAAVPEPASGLMMAVALGAAGLRAARRRLRD
ncbi:PEP-CTERM sorting domain-containing protein [Paucibacter sp. M5-1]|uniref:PEP-CTERM sorting domain-containing protein n=1 Tax=Paucibacter sp. M5-1 TaxID=3015998 RepID=UPI0022B8A42D|nr:PEP-CTERM sorting domain-containing protein [Paucibacter sp. M5-1]MCZ7880386.1 PEP-CTERM sorting domain-containing protein [Paucibacter sp. M5-1]